MDRRKFLSSMSAATVASIAGHATLSDKADALEEAMSIELDKKIATPWFCNVGPMPDPEVVADAPWYMHDDPRIPEMPQAPTLIDFFKLRFAPANHILQSARLAKINGMDEKVIIACLLHDMCVGNFIRTDHGYFAAQMLKPYVSEEVAWAIEAHQALRFYPDESVGYEYPEAYIRFFGADYRPEPYIEKAYQDARKHRWYMTSRLITLNDLYSFEEGVVVDVDDFTDIIGRNFKQPKEGLGFDGSPVAHMWRAMIWPNNFL
ncbi:MAG: HD domain-containing protein [Gammaproteobacteria bacterium]